MTPSVEARRTLRTLYAFGFSWMAVPIMPVVVPFLLTRGISTGEVVTLQGIFGIGVLLFEVPTGYLCDRLGRKPALVAGAVLNVAAFASLASAQGFTELVLVHLLMAAGWSLVSGADIALLYDLLERAGAERRRRQDALASYQLAQVLGEASAAAFGGLIAARSLLLLGWVNVGTALVPLALALLLPATPPSPRPEGARVAADLAASGRLVLRDRRRRLVFLNMTVWGLSTFAAVWLLQPYWAEQGVKLAWFGLLWAGTLLTVGAAAKCARLIERLVGTRNIPLVIALLPSLGYLGMAWLAGAPGIACGFLFYVSRGLNGVHLREAFNHDLPARLRATCNSLASGTFRLVFAVIGPVVGAIVDGAGMTAALTALGLAFLALTGVVALPLRRVLRAG